MTYYRLEGQTPVACDMFGAEGSLRKRDRRHVGDDTVGHLQVSTVFLGVDHQFHPGGPPLLFETMVFDQASSSRWADLYCDRYSTWEEAAAGHARVVAWLAAGKPLDDLGQEREEAPSG